MNTYNKKCDIRRGQKLEMWQKVVCVCNRYNFMSEKYQCNRCKVVYVHCYSFHNYMKVLFVTPNY